MNWRVFAESKWGLVGEKMISLCVLCNQVKKMKYKLLEMALNIQYVYTVS